MIKTYDEAVKTLNDVRTYLTINRADDCVEELDKVARYFINEKHKENSTLPECIKEWEERGWDWKSLGGYYYAFNTNNEDIEFNPKTKSCIICEEIEITLELSELIAKTLKSLEEIR